MKKEFPKQIILKLKSVGRIANLLILLSFSNAYAQYCSPSFGGTACSFPPYIDFSLSSASFSGTTFCTNVPCPTYYGDYFSTYTANLTEGNSYELTVNYNASSSLSPFSIYCGAWIDWNNDFIFDDATERIMTTNVGPAGATTQTGAPFLASTAGTFRMRIMLQTGSNPTNPCNSGGPDNGEAKDFKVIVAPGSVGTNQDQVWNNVTIYPNPSSINGLYINGLNLQHELVQLKLIDVLGNIVEQRSILIQGSSDQFIEINNKAKGIYYLTLTYGQSNKIFKLAFINKN